jgi:hypothetical protein
MRIPPSLKQPIKRVARALLIPLIIAFAAQTAWAGGRGTFGGTVHVRGYYRSNGTYVHSYERTAPRTSSFSATRSPSLGTSANSPRTSTAHVPDMSTFPKAVPVFPKAIPVAPKATPVAPDLFTTKPVFSGISNTNRYARSATASLGVQRDANGRIHRSESAKREFMRQSGHANGWPGYVVDHIVPLKRGGCDCPENMQWQTIQEAKAKDKVE